MARVAKGWPVRRYAALALGAVALGLAGYIGYVLYPRFDLPAGQGAALLLLAAGAGAASFFSPCSFPLLVTMLARPLAERLRAGGDDPSARRFASPRRCRLAPPPS